MRLHATLTVCFVLVWLTTGPGYIRAQQSAAAFAQEGLLEARREHYPAAIELYKQALALDPNLSGLQMNLGLAYFKSAQFPEAIRVFRSERKRHPDDPRLTILLGMSHYGMGDYLVASPYLEQAARREPQNLALRLTLAHSCLWSKQYDCVMTTYKEILALNAESAEADMLAGEALDAMGDAAGALAQFRAAVKANPQEPNLHYAIGYLLWTQSNYGEASREFQAELDHNADHAESWTYLGDCYLQTGDYQRAQAVLDKAVAVAPTSSMAHRDLGVAYAHSRRNDEAMREYLKAIELDPSDVAPHWRLAKLLQTMGRKDEAGKEFTIASTMVKRTNQDLSDKIGGVPDKP